MCFEPSTLRCDPISARNCQSFGAPPEACEETVGCCRQSHGSPFRFGYCSDAWCVALQTLRQSADARPLTAVEPGKLKSSPTFTLGICFSSRRSRMRASLVDSNMYVFAGRRAGIHCRLRSLFALCANQQQVKPTFNASKPSIARVTPPRCDASARTSGRVVSSSLSSLGILTLSVKYWQIS